MHRLFWVALGATAGVLVVRKLTRAANAWTPEGIAERTSSLGARLSEAAGQFRATVSEAAAAREAELRGALGLAEEAH
ncbi:MAG: DUF6167 family protein [Mycobacteriales bacterium]